jgi:hypothetical protein
VAEYVWAYVAAIKRAPLSAADKRECYGHLRRWAADRVLPSRLGLVDVGPVRRAVETADLVAVRDLVVRRAESAS